MKIGIKDAVVTLNSLMFALSKLDFRFLPDPLATLFVPYAEADRLMAAGIRCPGVGEPAVFSGSHKGRSVEGLFGGQLIGVKHSMRGIAFDVRLDTIEFDWSHDAGAKDQGSESPGEHEYGTLITSLVSPAFEPSLAGSGAEASVEQVL